MLFFITLKYSFNGGTCESFEKFYFIFICVFEFLGLVYLVVHFKSRISLYFIELSSMNLKRC